MTAIPITREPWMTRAACRGQSTTMHRGAAANMRLAIDRKTGKRVNPIHVADLNAALAYCAACTVHVECLDYAFQTGDTYSIYAGTTPEQRVALPGWKGTQDPVGLRGGQRGNSNSRNAIAQRNRRQATRDQLAEQRAKRAG